MTERATTKKPAAKTVAEKKEEVVIVAGEEIADQSAIDTGTTSMIVAEAERKVTWGYVRKKNLGNDQYGNPRYESEEVSLYVSDVVPPPHQLLTWAERQSEHTFDMLKSLVWDALELEFAFDELGKPKLVEPSPIKAVAQPSPLPPPPMTSMANPDPLPPPDSASMAAQAAALGHGGVTRPPTATGGSTNPKMAQIGVYAEPPAFCKQCGNREFYDNRQEVDVDMAAGKKIRPDFKCKNCDKGYFRPGSYEFNQAKG